MKNDRIKKTLLDEYEREFISNIISSVKGISVRNAIYLSHTYNTIESFLNVNDTELKNIKSESNRRIIGDSKLSAINEAKKEIIETQNILKESNIRNFDIRHIWMLYLTKDFVEKQLSNLESKTLENLDINPHLSFLLNLNKDDIIKFFVIQTISRSIVTSWGTYVEKFLKYSGGETGKDLDNLFGLEAKKKMKGSNVDIFKSVNNILYCMQVKSGPNTMNVEMISGLNRAMKIIEATDPRNEMKDKNIKTIVSLLGMTYGKRERISGQIKNNLNQFENKTKIGRELWDFIGEEENYYLQVLNVMRLASEKFLKVNFMNRVDQKVEEISTEWDNKYQNKPFEDVIKDNFI